MILRKVKKYCNISANNDEEIGILIADALSKVKERMVFLLLKESKGMETYTSSSVKVWNLIKGFISPYFCNQKDKQGMCS